MTCIIFEDSKKVATSKLLSLVYSDRVKFSESKNKLFQCIREECEKGNQAIAFVDVVPDNVDTLDSYITCFANVKKDKLDCILIPIPCFEFFFIKTFGNLLNCSKQELQYVLEYSPAYKTLKNLPDKIVSFERYCKYVYKTYKSRCMGKRGQLLPLFFAEDCRCSDCSEKYTFRLEEKAWKLWKQLPIMLDFDKVPVSLEFISVSDIRDNYIKIYNEAAERFSSYNGKKYNKIELF